MPTTPNMGMLLPVPTVTPGPTYASENNDAFEVVDSHDHSSGKGVPVPSDGININADLSFNNFNATTLRSVRFTSQGSPLSLPADLSCLYVSMGNLFYNNQLGQQVQITSGAAIDATSIGGIGGDYATSTALEFYTTFTRTFTFWSANNVPANLDAGSVTIREVTTSPHGLTLASPTGLAADYTITMPPALPASTASLVVSPSGIASFSPGANVPTGSVIMHAGTSAPSGYLLCDGTSYTRSSQANLFAAIGTAYGAADGIHFNVPDFRGIFPRGVDNGAGNDPDTLTRTAANPGGNAGDNVGSFQSHAFQSHTHTSQNFGNTNPGSFAAHADTSGGGAGLITTNSVSGQVSTETRPLNLYVNFIIKT